MGEAPPLTLHPPPPPPAKTAPEAEITPERPPLFQRRIEFHRARKASNGFGSGNCGGERGGFRMETLNPEKRSELDKGLEHRVVKSETGGGDRTGIDSELLSLRVTFKRIGAGLQNLGNTCFLNSVLQCLTYTEPLAAYLQSGKHQTSCRASGFCALCSIQKHVSRALNSSGRIVAPKDLVSNLRCISRNFRSSRQEDAHEYMVNLLESMHKCCLPSGVPSESPSAYERSLVHKIFGGQLCSQVKCMQCSYGSNKFDPFLDLSLEILKADSLQKALTHFTAKEQLDGGERQYQCQQCNQKVKALKQLTIYKPPHVLAIHLKRFGSHVQGQKINKKVDFSPTIDLKPFVTGPYDGDLKYTLYGVLVHAGWSTHSGHYYCFVRTSTGIWYSLDDNQVVQVGERKVLEQKAYMLFYVRDQTKFLPKKPTGPAHKETETNFNLLKASTQNGSIERKSNGSSSHASTQRDAVNASASNECLVKIPVNANVSKADQATSVDVNVKKSASLKDSSLANPNANASNGDLVKIPADTYSLKADHPTTLAAKYYSSMKDSSGKNLNVGEKVSASLEKGSVSNAHAAANGSISTVSLENGNKKFLNASVAELSQLNIPHVSAKDSKCDPCMKINSCNGHAGVEKAVIDAIGSPLDSNIIGTAKEASISMKTPKVEISKLSADSTRSAVSQKPELPAKLEIVPQNKSADKTSHLAVKKKLFKTPIMKMNLSTNIIFRTTFGLRKRKKHRGRSCNLVDRKSGQKLSADRDCNESGLGPSTSENYEMPTRGISPSSHKKKRKVHKAGGDDESPSSHKKKRKGHKSGGEDVTGTTDSQMIIDEPKERVCLNDHLVSTKKQQPIDCKTEIAAPAWSADKRKEANRNGLIRVLEETTVAKWDDIEVPATSAMGSEKKESVTIGYIGDEWDEDYDRGKQKKVRMNKFDFDGPNPFQEVASKKENRRPKMESRRRTKRPRV